MRNYIIFSCKFYAEEMQKEIFPRLRLFCELNCVCFNLGKISRNLLRILWFQAKIPGNFSVKNCNLFIFPIWFMPKKTLLTLCKYCFDSRRKLYKLLNFRNKNKYVWYCKSEISALFLSRINCSIISVN